MFRAMSHHCFIPYKRPAFCLWFMCILLYLCLFEKQSFRKREKERNDKDLPCIALCLALVGPLHSKTPTSSPRASLQCLKFWPGLSSKDIEQLEQSALGLQRKLSTDTLQGLHAQSWKLPRCFQFLIYIIRSFYFWWCLHRWEGCKPMWIID